MECQVVHHRLKPPWWHDYHWPGGVRRQFDVILRNRRNIPYKVGSSICEEQKKQSAMLHRQYHRRGTMNERFSDGSQKSPRKNRCMEVYFNITILDVKVFRYASITIRSVQLIYTNWYLEWWIWLWQLEVVRRLFAAILGMIKCVGGSILSLKIHCQHVQGHVHFGTLIAFKTCLVPEIQSPIYFA